MCKAGVHYSSWAPSDGAQEDHGSHEGDESDEDQEVLRQAAGEDQSAKQIIAEQSKALTTFKMKAMK